MEPEHPVGLDQTWGSGRPLSIKARPADAPSGQPCATFSHICSSVPVSPYHEYWAGMVSILVKNGVLNIYTSVLSSRI